LTKKIENTLGHWADGIADKEVTLSKDAAKILSDIDWAKPLLKESKISNTPTIQPFNNRSYDKMQQIKSAFFEVRFALAIHQAGFTAGYECKTGVEIPLLIFAFMIRKINEIGWLNLLV
jgi:hypothetical protein